MIGNDKKTLGELLKELRTANKLTLREMERRSGISNAYLSQVESGQIKQPSPNYLHKMAEVLNYPYDALLERAGHIVPGQNKPRKQPKAKNQSPEQAKAFAIFSSIKDLTEDEAEALVEFLNWHRSRKGK